jgi:hypothetical protein
MQMKIHEPYDENNGEHQNPIQGISEWQEWNDPHGIEATRWALKEQKVLGDLDDAMFERDMEKVPDFLKK